MKILGIIPARYASTRFPGKPLVRIAGKTMIRRVYEQVSKALEFIVVATDDKRIFDEVNSFGGRAIMTNSKHKSGTDRCLEALQKIEQHAEQDFDIVINIQGDEPLISPQAILQLANSFNDTDVEIATLANSQSFSEELKNPNIVKISRKLNGFASYFSRSLIPFARNLQLLEEFKFYTHIGIYAYRKNILQEITKLPQSPNELIEGLEQNRWLDNDYKIKVLLTEYHSIGVDTPEDLKKIEKLLEKGS